MLLCRCRSSSERTAAGFVVESSMVAWGADRKLVLKARGGVRKLGATPSSVCIFMNWSLGSKPLLSSVLFRRLTLLSAFYYCKLNPSCFFCPHAWINSLLNCFRSKLISEELKTDASQWVEVLRGERDLIKMRSLDGIDLQPGSWVSSPKSSHFHVAVMF